MEREGGGRIKRSAFMRVFGDLNDGRDLDADWACDDTGVPE